MSLFWMSFSDPDRPEGVQFLGVALVEAANEVEMMTKSHLTGCNPGGEIQFVSIDMEAVPEDMRKALENAPRDILMPKILLEKLGLLD
jgi:hypothetical protein